MESLIKSGAIYKLIENELVNLPGEKAHLEMIPFRTTKSLIDAKGQPSKSSAILCLLSPTNGHLEITLMERTKDSSPHSGQISFPGGKREKRDSSLAETALRETHEEIGIHTREISLIGQLTPLYIPVSNFNVTPFIGYCEKIDNLTLSEREVQSVFSITIEDLLDPSNLVSKDIPNHLGQILKNVPCFFIKERVIWGATSLILNEVRLIFQSIINNTA